MKSVGEIQAMLFDHHAKSIRIDSQNGEPCGIAFLIPTVHGEIAFKLPADVEKVKAVLARGNTRKRQAWGAEQLRRDEIAKQQASKVAWRLLRDWVRAQMAIIESETVTLEQVFLPYMQVEGEKTLYESMESRRFLLGSGKKEGES